MKYMRLCFGRQSAFNPFIRHCVKKNFKEEHKYATVRRSGLKEHFK